MTTGLGRIRVNFLSGFLLGVGLLAVAWLALIVVGYVDQSPRHAMANVRVAGATLKHAGATALVLRDRYETLRQDCRDACDDLRVNDADALYGYSVEVLNARGDCLFCNWTSEGLHDGRNVFSMAQRGVVMRTDAPY
jgi:hypothetical protein